MKFQIIILHRHLGSPLGTEGGAYMTVYLLVKASMA